MKDNDDSWAIQTNQCPIHFGYYFNQGYLHLDFKGGSVNLFIGGKLPQMDLIEIMMIHGRWKPINAQSISNATLIKGIYI